MGRIYLLGPLRQLRLENFVLALAKRAQVSCWICLAIKTPTAAALFSGGNTSLIKRSQTSTAYFLLGFATFRPKDKRVAVLWESTEPLRLRRLRSLPASPPRSAGLLPPWRLRDGSGRRIHRARARSFPNRKYSSRTCGSDFGLWAWRRLCKRRLDISERLHRLRVGVSRAHHFACRVGRRRTGNEDMLAYAHGARITHHRLPRRTRRNIASLHERSSKCQNSASRINSRSPFRRNHGTKIVPCAKHAVANARDQIINEIAHRPRHRRERFPAAAQPRENMDERI